MRKSLLRSCGLLIVILLLLAVVTAIVEPTFMTVKNLTAIMRQFGALSFIALGLTFAVITGFIDLSIPGIARLHPPVTCRVPPGPHARSA